MFRDWWWLPGGLLILFGLVIVIYPELLALMFASLLIFAGISWLTAAWTARRLRKPARIVYVETFDRWFGR